MKRISMMQSSPVLLLISISLLSCPVMADREGERETLSRLVHELNALEPLIQQAEAYASSDHTRVRFEYQWLRRDLQRIRTGISDHIHAPRTEPRRFEPLQGDYRH